MGGFIPGLVVMGGIRKQAELGEQAIKWHSSMAFASALASRILPYLSSVLTSLSGEQCCGSINWINPFLPDLLFGHGVWMQ